MMHIRPATERDLIAIARIYEHALRTADWLPDSARQISEFAAASAGEEIRVGCSKNNEVHLLRIAASSKCSSPTQQQESGCADRALPLTSRDALYRMWPFGLWLVVFYSAWLLIVVLGDHWQTVQSHWPIALAVSFGSYIAGSTPMGGGSVGFPVLVLLFELPGSLGRNFGLAVQSIGMVSASIYIFSARRPLDGGLLRPALLGALIGTPLGAALVAPFVPDLWVKLTFAVVWCSFGIMHLVKLDELVSAQGESERWRAWDRPIGMAIGISGGVVSSVTGVGIDMIIYATLVLLYRADLKVRLRWC